MTARATESPVVLVFAEHAKEREQILRELEAAGVPAVIATTATEARAAAGLRNDGAPPELAQMAVHNLKTPLTSMLAALEMLADGDLGPVNERQGMVLRDTHTRGLELLALIENLLELWTLESSPLALSVELIDPVELLADVRRDWVVAFERAGARLHLEEVVAPSFPGDRAVLRRVLGNLTHNALVHAGDGITVRLGARADADEVRFTVTDDGRGIPREYHDAIFARFARIPRSVARTRGTGLGLAFCRLAVSMHGGRIWVESGEGQGSAFCIGLPSRGSGTRAGALT